jgi:hypothetical protein
LGFSETGKDEPHPFAADVVVKDLLKNRYNNISVVVVRVSEIYGDTVLGITYFPHGMKSYTTMPESIKS